MANDITGNPWILITAEEITDKPFRCKYLEWTPTTSGDDLLVVDNAGNTIWTRKTIAADSNQGISEEKRIDGVLNGMTITTIDHGTLYVYL
jgi:hypothetical protein